MADSMDDSIDMLAFEVFFERAFQKLTDMSGPGRCFVHYTTADTAFHIIQSSQVWMRKSSMMNDYSEVEYGATCLKHALRSEAGERLQKFLEGMFPGAVSTLMEYYEGWLPIFKDDTYLTCISEHDPLEDDIGRLSMWRSYGGANGVALVLSPRVFLTPSDALKAYTNPGSLSFTRSVSA